MAMRPGQRVRLTRRISMAERQLWRARFGRAISRAAASGRPPASRSTRCSPKGRPRLRPLRAPRHIHDPEGFQAAEAKALEAGLPSHVALPIHAATNDHELITTDVGVLPDVEGHR